MQIGILGNGNLAVALGKAWAAAGHVIVLTGRDPDRVQAAAQQVGASATPVGPDQFAGRADVIVVAIAWDGLEPALSIVGGPQGQLAGKTVIDCTNPVDFATGRVRLESGSAAEVVAGLVAGAHVVKALNVFAGASWPFTGDPDTSPVVAVCGDQAGALDQVASLIADLGARTAMVGGLATARQIEEAAGFVMRLVAVGANPRDAVPDVDPRLLSTGRANE